MTAPAIVQPIDPTGLGGTLYLDTQYDEGRVTARVQLWTYPSTIDFVVIRDRWTIERGLAYVVRAGTVHRNGTRTVIVKRRGDV